MIALVSRNPWTNFLSVVLGFVLFSQPIAMGDVGEDFLAKSRYDDGRDALWIGLCSGRFLDLTSHQPLH